MERSSHEHAVFLGSDFTLAPDSYTTWMSYNLTDHVFGSLTLDTFYVGFATAYRPLGDVVRPNVRCH